MIQRTTFEFIEIMATKTTTIHSPRTLEKRLQARALPTRLQHYHQDHHHELHIHRSGIAIVRLARQFFEIWPWCRSIFCIIRAGKGARSLFVIQEGRIYTLIPREDYSYFLSRRAHRKGEMPIWCNIIGTCFFMT